VDLLTRNGRRARIAIACQGGGSHTAFTAGVLKRLFESDDIDRYEVVGLSGTSGGAVCALLAWSAVAEGVPEQVGSRLSRFWTENSASTPVQRLLNSWVMGTSTLQNVGAAPAVSPYDVPTLALDQFRDLLRRQLDFDRIEPDPQARLPMLLIGAVDVLSGEFRAFSSRRDRITPDAVLASAAIPNLFPALHTGDGTYWDGLFSQNPPVRELLDTRPDEIWVIQINPKETDTEPRTVVEIADRRNELSGNLSLYQELHFIEEMNRLLDEGLLRPGGRYGHVVVRIIELARSRTSRLWGPASKLDRDPGFLRQLIDQGELQATEFLTALGFEDAWGRHDTEGVARFLADDAEADSSAPFPERGPVRGRTEVHRFLQDHFASAVCMDLNRKQVVRDHVTWTAQGQVEQGGPAVEGRCEVTFAGETVTRLRLGAAL
jgi:NTE family protein